MSSKEKQMTEAESLALIAKMISKAKDACHDTGISAMMWGGLIAFCSLERLAEIQFQYRLPFDIFILTIFAVIPQVMINRKERKEKKVKSYDDVFQGNLWMAFGICIFLLIFILNVLFRAWEPWVQDYLQAGGKPVGFMLQEYTAALFLLLYGMPTFVTGMNMNFKPMIWGGILCWVCCLLTLFTPLKADLILTALSAIFAWFIPGIIMEKDFRKAKIGLTQIHV